METKVALVIIYNHRFDRNISKLENLYKGKFSNIYHIMPFYDGLLENVIPVYESSYFFSGYIAQAYSHLKKMRFTHYFFVADDMIINPAINERNLWDEIGINENDDMMPSTLLYLQDRKKYWRWGENALNFKIKQAGVEIESILPSKEEAISIFQKHNYPLGPVNISMVTSFTPKSLRLTCLFKNKYLDYPMVGAYSDILLVTNKTMPKFAQYCGAFAAKNLFVEIAVPTSLILSSNNIKFDKDIKFHHGALWGKEVDSFNSIYKLDLDILLKEYPSDKLFFHPVKLSKWKNSL